MNIYSMIINENYLKHFKSTRSTRTKHLGEGNWQMEIYTVTCVVGNIHWGPYWDHMGTWVNKYETDSPLWVRRMDSASMVEMSMHWKEI